MSSTHVHGSSAARSARSDSQDIHLHLSPYKHDEIISTVALLKCLKCAKPMFGPIFAGCEAGHPLCETCFFKCALSPDRNASTGAGRKCFAPSCDRKLRLPVRDPLVGELTERALIGLDAAGFRNEKLVENLRCAVHYCDDPTVFTICKNGHRVCESCFQQTSGSVDLNARHPACCPVCRDPVGIRLFDLEDYRRFEIARATQHSAPVKLITWKLKKCRSSDHDVGSKIYRCEIFHATCEKCAKNPNFKCRFNFPGNRRCGAPLATKGKQAVRYLGLEDILEAIFVSNAPTEDILNKALTCGKCDLVQRTGPVFRCVENHIVCADCQKTSQKAGHSGDGCKKFLSHDAVLSALADSRLTGAVHVSGYY